MYHGHYCLRKSSFSITVFFWYSGSLYVWCIVKHLSQLINISHFRNLNHFPSLAQTSWTRTRYQNFSPIVWENVTGAETTEDYAEEKKFSEGSCKENCASVGGGEPVIVPPRKVIEVVKEEFFKGIGFWMLSLFLLLWLLDANSPSIVLILHFSMPQLLDHTYAIYYPSNIQDLISLQIYENHEVFQHIYFHINLNIN
jgi:hypothetical protein